MRRRPITILAIVLVAVAVLTAAGCGGKKSTSTTTTTTAAATTATSTSTTTTTTEASSTTAEGTTTTSLGSLGSVANCKSLADLGAAFEKAFTGAGGDLQKEAQVLKDFASKTPEDIRPDFEKIADAFSKVTDALKGVDLNSGKTPDAATLAKLTQLSTEFSTPEMTKAEAHIEAWAAKNCHG